MAKHTLRYGVAVRATGQRRWPPTSERGFVGKLGVRRGQLGAVFGLAVAVHGVASQDGDVGAEAPERVPVRMRQVLVHARAEGDPREGNRAGALRRHTEGAPEGERRGGYSLYVRSQTTNEKHGRAQVCALLYAGVPPVFAVVPQRQLAHLARTYTYTYGGHHTHSQTRPRKTLLHLSGSGAQLSVALHSSSQASSAPFHCWPSSTWRPPADAADAQHALSTIVSIVGRARKSHRPHWQEGRAVCGRGCRLAAR